MPTDAIPGLFSQRTNFDESSRGAPGPLTRVVQTLCAISGHEYLMHVSPHRIFLRCSWCQRETRGWDLE